MQIIQKPHTYFPYIKKSIWLPSTLFAYSFNGDITSLFMHYYECTDDADLNKYFPYTRESRVVCTWKQLREFMTISLIFFLLLALFRAESNDDVMMFYNANMEHRLESVCTYFNKQKKKCEMCEKQISIERASESNNVRCGQLLHLRTLIP